MYCVESLKVGALCTYDTRDQVIQVLDALSEEPFVLKRAAEYAARGKDLISLSNVTRQQQVLY